MCLIQHLNPLSTNPTIVGLAFKGLLFNILRSKQDLIMKLGQIIKCFKRKKFIEKYAESVHQKLVPNLNLISIYSPKYSQCIQETLLEIRYFERGLSQILLKSNLILI